MGFHKAQPSASEETEVRLITKSPNSVCQPEDEFPFTKTIISISRNLMGIEPIRRLNFGLMTASEFIK